MKCRHLYIADQKSVQGAQKSAEDQAEQKRYKDASGHVEDHNAEACVQGQQRPDRQVDLADQADKAHADRDDADDCGMAEDIHDAIP